MALLAAGGIPRLVKDVGTPAPVQGFRAVGIARLALSSPVSGGLVQMRASEGPARLSYGTAPAGILTWLNVGGIWKQANVWINVAGVWKAATMNLKVGGIWKP